MYQVYQIKEGENLNDVANKLNINISELKRLNGLTDNIVLKSGSYIIIPNSNYIGTNYSKYIIKKGDTLYSIAKANNIDYQTLVKFNGLKDGEYIYPEQEIIIPSINTYITKEKETIKDVLTKLNINIDNIKDLYLEEDQIINY